MRSGKHKVKNRKQAIAIGLSKARQKAQQFRRRRPHKSSVDQLIAASFYSSFLDFDSDFDSTFVALASDFVSVFDSDLESGFFESEVSLALEPSDEPESELAESPLAVPLRA